MNEKRAFVFAQIGVLCAVLAAVFLLPGAPVARTVLLLAAVWGISLAAYSAAPEASSAGRWTLLAAFALLSVGLVANVHYFTAHCGATSSAPVLLNDDASVAWQVMSRLLGGGIPDGSITVPSRFGYGRFLAFTALFLGRDVAALLTVNVLFVMLTVVLAERIAAMVAPAGMERRISATAMIMIASVCYFLASGVILIKDACCCFIMAQALFSILYFRCHSGMRRSVSAGAGMLAAVALAAVVRPSLLLFMAMALVALVPWRTRRGLFAGLAVLLSLAATYVFIVFFTDTTYSPDVAFSQSEDMALQTYGDSERMRDYTSVVGVYYLYSPLERILRLPMSLAVQYLTPFPWGYGKHLDFGYSLAYAHFAWPWYAVGGLAVFYLLSGLCRPPRLLARLSLLGVAMTVVVALIYGGLVSRYCLPWLPAIVPSAAVVWHTCMRGRRFKIYAVAYVVLLGAALLVCRYLQTAPGGQPAL